MSYKHIIRGITHWHEHEIHDRISPILGYDSWAIGTGRVLPGRSPNYHIDLTLTFRSKDEYLQCRETIAAVCAMEPE